ncbi:MAG: SIS domain-containing protein [Deltaproteobacteria bacterium]|jgi:D-sedoheptulose 7-phosphate isomerase|nr:SIS domain-containing protein [Deltaproteobacteria bacterium]
MRALHIEENTKGFSLKYIENLKGVLDGFPYDQFALFIDAVVEAYQKEKRIFVMGNGGSGSTASHWVCDINKGCSLNRDKRFKMICLNDSMSTVLAYGNDSTYDNIFVEQLKNFFVPGDVVIGISGSGNSKNVLNAIEYAGNNGGTTVGLCGYSGGALGRMVDIPILARVDDMQQVEDVHMIVVHMSMQAIIKELERVDRSCA